MFSVCILMGGVGVRTTLGYNKALYKINNKPLFMYSVETFAKHPELKEIILVVNNEDYNNYDFSIMEDLDKEYKIVIGGATRFASSLAGCSEACEDIVLVHDAARPLINIEDINNIYSLAKTNKAVISGVKVYDSVKYIKNGKFENSINRDNVFLSSTPQAIHKNEYLTLAKKFSDVNLSDEASLYEASFCDCVYYYLKHDNRKFTTLEDLEYITERLTYTKGNYKIGYSKDTHRLEKGRKLIIGGIEIPYELGEVAHSDGDCLIHAIVEAMLGCLGLHDIGYYFPDDDPLYKDASSIMFLEFANSLLKKHGYKIVNIDTMIYLEKPKLKDYKLLIKNKLAEILKINIDQISIKATTKEGLGVIGEGKAIEAEAFILIEKE